MSDESMALVRSQESRLMPALSVESAIMRYNMMGEFIQQVMKENVDYGTIPGTEKSTLYKAGAEKLKTLFGLQLEFALRERVQDWTGDEHGGETFFYYWYTARLSRDGFLVAEADGSCNSWESKYRYRKANRVCPACKQEAIIKSKYDSGWYCFPKKGGCGAKFQESDDAIESQETGRVANADMADLVNTVQKMAQKRAFVAATLLATNASNWFTQDIEDFEPVKAKYAEPEPEVEPEPQSSKQPHSANASQEPGPAPESLASERSGVHPKWTKFLVEAGSHYGLTTKEMREMLGDLTQYQKQDQPMKAAKQVLDEWREKQNGPAADGDDPLDELRKRIRDKGLRGGTDSVEPGLTGLCVNALEALFPADQPEIAKQKRYGLLKFFFGKESAKHLKRGEASALLDWAQENKAPRPEAIREAGYIIKARDLEAGQASLFDENVEGAEELEF